MNPTPYSVSDYILAVAGFWFLLGGILSGIACYGIGYSAGEENARAKYVDYVTEGATHGKK